MPQSLLVLHNGVIIGGSSFYTVQADTLSWIALSVDGEILGVEQGTGAPVDIAIPAQNPGTLVKLVVTKTNHYRYEMMVPVIAPDAPYVVFEEYQISDGDGNSNGMADYGEEINLGMTVQNIGLVDAEDVTATLSCSDPYVTISDASEEFGLVPGSGSVNIADAFLFQLADTVPDMHNIFFTLVCTDSDTSWTSEFMMVAHAPVLELVEFTIDDSQGNGNNHLDPGETVEITVTITNSGSSDAFGIINGLSTEDQYISVLSEPQEAGDLPYGASTQSTFTVFAEEYTPGGFIATFMLDISGNQNISGQGEFTTLVGQYSAVIIDLDPNQQSGPAILEAFGNMDLYADYQTQLPDDLSDFKSVFLSLGILFSNHELTTAEAALLAGFLENGGKLYMEGRTTWYDDPQTALHTMFNVNTVFDNWFIVDTLTGQQGTFTEGMKFAFEAVNPYNKYHLEAVAPAFELFRTTEDTRGTWVAYDEGTYKTIAASMEFGGLVDGEDPSTKEKVLQGILEFFGDILTGTGDDRQAVASGITVFPNPFGDQVSFTFDLGSASRVTLEVFNLTGQKVSTVFDGSLPAGANQLTWKTSETGPGMLFYRLTTEQGTLTGKLIRK